MTLTSLHNLERWAEDEDAGAVDIGNPQALSPWSLIDPGKEPEGETFCHRHGIEKHRFKPMVKLQGQYHVAQPGFMLFYCPKCMVELLSSAGGDAREIIDKNGGFEKTVLAMLTQSAGESGDVSELPGGPDMWDSHDEIPYKVDP